MKDLLSIEELSRDTLHELLDAASYWKEARKAGEKPLEGQTWAMIFTKASTRTRVSFEVGLNELGAKPMFLSKNDIQLGRGEPIKDTARVLGRMVHGIIIRTFAQKDVVDLAGFSKLPTINALTDDAHPCQILADLLTVREKLGGWEGKKIAFIGDGFNNMTRSWIWAAKNLGFELAVASPEAYLPPAEYLEKLEADHISVTTDPKVAVKGADVINTDVWVSMGEEEQTEKEAHFAPYQVNAELLDGASPDHVVLHCLPAYRGKEITEEILEAHADTIFQQAENRLHAQKAVLAKIGSSFQS